MSLMFALMGCATSGALGRAELLPPGQSELLAGTEVSLIRSETHALQGMPAPALTIGFRHGLTRDLELGIHASGFYLGGVQYASAGADLKVGLVHPEGPGSLAASLAPGVGIQQGVRKTSSALGYSLSLPLLLGLDLGEQRSVVLSPRVLYQHLDTAGRVTDDLYAGLGLGFVAPILPQLSLMPQVVGLCTIPGLADASSGSLVFSLGLMLDPPPITRP